MRISEASISNIAFRTLVANTATISDTMIYNSDWPFRLRHFKKLPNQQGQTIRFAAECDSQQAFGWGKDGPRKTAGKRQNRMVKAQDRSGNPIPLIDPRTGKVRRDKWGHIQYKLVQRVLRNPMDRDVQSYPVYIEFYNVNIAGGEKPSIDRHPCKVSCGCQAYYFWFGFYNNLANCHLGKPPVPYRRVVPDSGRPNLNPRGLPGACKHLIAFADQLKNGGELE